MSSPQKRLLAALAEIGPNQALILKRDDKRTVKLLVRLGWVVEFVGANGSAFSITPLGMEQIQLRVVGLST